MGAASLLVGDLEVATLGVGRSSGLDAHPHSWPELALGGSGDRFLCLQMTCLRSSLSQSGQGLGPSAVILPRYHHQQGLSSTGLASGSLA